jgi:hypothetical protein
MKVKKLKKETKERNEKPGLVPGGVTAPDVGALRYRPALA